MKKSGKEIEKNVKNFAREVNEKEGKKHLGNMITRKKNKGRLT